MKLSFSTLACPDFSWTEIYSMAKDFGLDGIEVRGLGKELSAIHAAHALHLRVHHHAASRAGRSIPGKTPARG